MEKNELKKISSNGFNNLTSMQVVNQKYPIMYMIFGNLYIIHYMIKSHILKGLRHSDKSSIWRKTYY